MKTKNIITFILLILVGGTVAILMSTKKAEPLAAANRFIYEFKYKPNIDKDTLFTVMTVLDVVDNNYSLYRDYTIISQDSVLKAQMENMKRTGSYVQMEKLVKMPKFGYRILKNYPLSKGNKIQFIDGIERSLFAYEETVNLEWNIQTDTATISTYSAQKATTTFGGRTWFAWFSTDIPIKDGPYKFGGLPGLIIKLQDAENNFSWNLVGNVNINNFVSESFADRLYYGNNVTPKIISKTRFKLAYQEYKKAPLAAVKSQLNEDQLNTKVPGTNLTKGEMIESQELVLKEILNYNNNPIEK